MARMPDAKWQPLAANWADQPVMKTFDIVCIHTMVGGLIGTDGYFRTGNGVGFAGTESHFGTGGEGEIVQWQDTSRRADANLDGNWHVISIENADMGPGFPKWNTNDGAAVPAFTEAQMDAVAKIVAWACKTHNIPCELIPDAKPGRRGVGYHRQGVPGYMVTGAEKWSSAPGKVCPGDRRIKQIPEIIRRAKLLLNPPANSPVNSTATTELEKIITMELSDSIESRIDADVDPKTGRGKMVTVRDVLQNIQWNADRTRRAVEAVVNGNGDTVPLGAIAVATEEKLDKALAALRSTP